VRNEAGFGTEDTTYYQKLLKHWMCSQTRPKVKEKYQSQVSIDGGTSVVHLKPFNNLVLNQEKTFKTG